MSITYHKELFDAFTFKSGVSVRNRVAMAPMTTWASNEDATISDDEEQHYRARVNDVGLVITGCTRVQANGQGFPGEYAAYDDQFIPSLKRLADAAKSGGAPAIMQIFHAGNKAVPELVPGGVIVSSSAIEAAPQPFLQGGNIPRALEHEEVLAVIKAFGDATRRAIAAGFDGVELHGAHGFLLQNFFSPYSNDRKDHWGGSLENRMNFPLAVVQEVQRVVKANADRPFMVGYRISPEESYDGGYRINDSYRLIDRLIDLDIDYIHASLTSVADARPIGAMDDQTIVQLLVKHINGRIPLIAAGQVKTPEVAVKAIEEGLTMVAVGQGLIINPDWVEFARKGQQPETVLRTSRIDELHIPGKLLQIIDIAKGWFPVEEDLELNDKTVA